MTKYDMLFIVNNTLSNEDKGAVVEKVVDSIKSLNGVVETIDKWGAKKFAYPIKKQKEGYYVLVKFEAGEDVPAELDRQMRINEKILRQLITKQVSTPMASQDKKVEEKEEVEETEVDAENAIEENKEEVVEEAPAAEVETEVVAEETAKNEDSEN